MKRLSLVNLTQRGFLVLKPFQVGRRFSATFDPRIYSARTATGTRLTLNSQSDAETFLRVLGTEEREFVAKALEAMGQSANGNGSAAAPLSAVQMRTLFTLSALPFVGFGLLDNLLMILCGEYIDQTVGVTLGLSTMAAAGLGNIFSDVAGVGTAHYVEYLVAKLGITTPMLSAKQWNSSRARWATNLGRAIGISVGCLLGMFPLLFFDETHKQELKLQAKEAAVIS